MTREVGPAGIVRSLACTPTAREDAVAAARRWCVDRALPAETVADVARLVDEAAAYASLFGPRHLVLTMRWADLDRISIELAWQGCAAQAMAAEGPPGVSLQRSTAVFDGLAEAWGLGTAQEGDSWQWFTVDTRRARRSAARVVARQAVSTR